MLNGLIVWPENYNRGDVETIALSIRHFGFNSAPRIWRDVHVLSQSKYPTRAIGTKDFRGTVDNVFTTSVQRQNEFADLHAATMPLDVAGHLITNFTNRGERVLDPFCGTGTTIVACESRGRLGSGVELSPVYVACTLERLTLMGLTVERGS